MQKNFAQASWLVILGAFGGLPACGADGANGLPGVDGEAGLTSLVNVSKEKPGKNCDAGGQKIESGLDADADGELGPGEISQTTFACNGEDGLNGVDGARGADGEPGADGQNGSGDKAHTSLVKVTTETAGTDCAAGGQKIESGVDDDDDGALDATEVDARSFVCNGAGAGPQGEQGPQGEPGANGADGVDGAPGADGVDGVDGAPGADGVDGAPGADGSDGADGIDGQDGAPGTDGADGQNGATGTDGTDGTSCSVATTYIGSAVNPVVRVSCTDGTSAVVNAGPLTPAAASASSVENGSAQDALDPDQAWWLSTIDSGNPEWLQYDFGAGKQVLVTGVRGYIVNGRDGNPEFQGSNDGTTWTTLGTWDFDKFTFDAAPWQGWGAYVDTFDTSSATTGYRYVRAYSQGAPYLLYSYLAFDGVELQ